ncbi:synembryn-A-like [Littorina saxatilis]|uniref:Synembryn-A n=1 Tax=Littorina saxatilis TaxID=31220 RepID=A0AAN9G9D0_9CAEN
MMSEADLQILQSGTETELEAMLKRFNTANEKVFTFPDLKPEMKEKYVNALLNRFEQNLQPETCIACLQAFRVFSREKTNMDTLTSERSLRLLMKLAGIEYYAAEPGENVAIQNGNQDVMIEGQKCLCNLIFNSTTAQQFCSKTSCVDGVVQRLKTYGDPELKFDVKFYDMRILFLLTALPACVDTRPRVRYELHGFTYLMEVLDLTLRACEEDNRLLSDTEVDLCSEILKILFNLTVALEKKSADEEEDAHFMRLVSILRDLLLCRTASKEKKQDLKSHTVNLLINIPTDFYEELLTPLNESDICGVENKDIEFDGKNMEAIISLLDFLQSRLDSPMKNVKEKLSPILHCLVEASRHNRSIRKFCRLRVLPPLRSEVMRLPEEGNSLRNKLCKLLTSPITEIKDLVAHFLFILCKENVGRMVKYTGYGNCSGLLAQLGLLKMKEVYNKGDYSSDSEESDTEEYAELRGKINPVTGRYEEEKPGPMEGMTDEQKEYEAEELLKVMDKLQRQGVIQPCLVGEDGKPKPVEHVLELLEQGGASASSSSANAGPSSAPDATDTG